MAVSEARLAANRANAQKSTGPRTAAGKRAARLNALRHGLAGETAVLPAEAEAFGALLADMEGRFLPVGEAERALVRRMAESLWRMRRCPALEAITLAALIEQDEAGELDPEGAIRAPQLLLRIGRYEGQIERSYERALERLRLVQRARLAEAQAAPRPVPAPPPRPAAPAPRAEAPKPRTAPRNSAPDGFVSSNPPEPPRGPLADRLRASCAADALLAGGLAPPWPFAAGPISATLGAAEDLPRAA